MSRTAVHDALELFGRAIGLEKRASEWYRRTEEVIAISAVQKSQYGPQYYVNQGFWLRELGHELYPAERDCGISLRLEVLVPAQQERIGELLDLDHEMPDAERVDEVARLLCEHLLPVIERAGTVSGLRSLVADGTLAGAAVRAPAQRVLSL